MSSDLRLHARLKCYRKPSTSAADNTVTTGDVTTRAASIDMPTASAAARDGGPAKRTSSRRQQPSHRSTPNIATASQAAVESRWPNGPAAVDPARGRTTSASRGRQSTAGAAADEIANRRTGKSTPRSVTSRDVVRTTTTTTMPSAWRSTTPTPSSPAKTASSPRQPAAAGSNLAASKKQCRSTGNLTTMSPASLSPPPKRRVPSNVGAAAVATKSSPSVAARHQPGGFAESKPVVISGRGSRAQAAAAAAATASTHDGGGVGGKNASMRSRIGIAPNLLLPNCYQPGKTTPGTPTRSVSIDASIPTSPPDVAAAHHTGIATPPRVRRSVSVEERRTSPPLQPKTAFDDYPEPPPEDRELNSRMELLFEEYRKVERGLIFTNEQSPRSDNSAANNRSSASTKPSQTESSKSFAGRVTAGKRESQTVGSTRAKSVGNLFMGSSPSTFVSSQQLLGNRAVHATASSSGTSVSTCPGMITTSGRPSGSRPSTTYQRGQSSPGLGRRSTPQPATPPPSRNTAVSSGVTASRPRQQTGKLAAAQAPAAGPTDVGGPAAPTGVHRARSCGGGGVRRESLPASLRLQDFTAADNSFTGVDTTQQSKRRPSTPSLSATPGGHVTPAAGHVTPAGHVPRSAEQVRANSRRDGGRYSAAVSERRRQSATTVSERSGRVSAELRQSASHDGSRHATDQVDTNLPDKERRSRPSTVGVRSLIPRPVSCSGRPPSRRCEDRNPPVSIEQVLRRFDSGVDVAAAGLSPSDDGVGASSLEAVVQRLSASLESCTLALLADDENTPSARQNKQTTVNAVDTIDDEYY